MVTIDLGDEDIRAVRRSPTWPARRLSLPACPVRTTAY